MDNEKRIDENDAFKRELCSLLNRYSVDALANVPDFILTDFMVANLAAFLDLTADNDKWHSGVLKP